MPKAGAFYILDKEAGSVKGGQYKKNVIGYPWLTLSSGVPHE